MHCAEMRCTRPWKEGINWSRFHAFRLTYLIGGCLQQILGLTPVWRVSLLSSRCIPDFLLSLCYRAELLHVLCCIHPKSFKAHSRSSPTIHTSPRQHERQHHATPAQHKCS